MKNKVSKNKKIKKNISKKGGLGEIDDDKIDKINSLRKLLINTFEGKDLEDSCPNGKTHGKSSIIVRSCDKKGKVSKKIQKNILQNGIIDYKDNALKVTPSIMFILHQLITYKLYEKKKMNFHIIIIFH